MDILLSFLGGIVLAALTAFFISRSIVKSRVAQTEKSVRLQAESSFKVEQARLESDLGHARERAEELLSQLGESKDEAAAALLSAKEEARQQVQEARDTAAAVLQASKDEAAAVLQRTKEEAARLLEETKADLRKRSEEDIAAREKAHKDAMTALQIRFDETMAKISAQVKSDTSDMLKARQQEFSQASNLSLGQIVTPLKENIAELRKAMEQGREEQAERSGQMREHIKNLMEQSEAARKSADELAAAFKHGSKMQGDWGETILEELLSTQGLTKGVHFDTQAVIRDSEGHPVKNEDGSIMRPDVILHLDERREVIIDSKVSLSAYVDYVNAENETDRRAFLKAHVESVRQHVKELSQKDYSAYVKSPKVSAGYVIMFVPNVGALWTALNAEPDLWRKAADMNVYIADEQSLYGALKIVSMTWTQVSQAHNHEKVYELANEMIDRVGLFMEKYEAVGKALKKASDEYEDGRRKLTPRGQSIINTSSKLIKLGARNSDKHPIKALLDVDDIPSLPPPSPEPGYASEPDSLPEPGATSEPEDDPR